MNAVGGGICHARDSSFICPSPKPGGAVSRPSVSHLHPELPAASPSCSKGGLWLSHAAHTLSHTPKSTLALSLQASSHSNHSSAERHPQLAASYTMSSQLR